MFLSNNYHVLMDLNYVLTRILIKIYLIFIIKEHIVTQLKKFNNANLQDPGNL
jgi:hypothetical protein